MDKSSSSNEDASNTDEGDTDSEPGTPPSSGSSTCDSQEEAEDRLCPAARLLLARKASNNNMYGKVRRSSQLEEVVEEEVEEGRLTSAMKVREDTLDGAEAPDTDPPQRRKTIEDISIVELSALRASLPPEYPEDESPPTLLPCLTCNRTFNPTALDRHRKVCQKLSESSKKKQVFNAHTQRFEGLEATASAGVGNGRAKTPERKNSAQKKTSRWREKHKEFLRTIRAARGTPEGDAEAGAPSVPSDYIKCPYCERHFGPKAADRHIEWCKEQNARLRRTSVDAQLTERLKNRTKYVPPKPGQSGWRAPKKTDVISSIPPPSTGPPGGGDRRISPPPLAHPRRGVSPGPQRQYSTASLGRAAARSFNSLLQAVSGNPYASPYGQRGSSSGYATPSSYSAYGGHAGGSQTPSLTRSGSFSESSPGGSFARSASLRVPNSRRNTGGRIARRRDLASDMLASVCLGDNPARGEPEGNEADDFSSRETTLSPPPYKSPNELNKYESPFDSKFESSTYEPSKYEISKFEPSKFDDIKFDDSIVELSYDPYSAAEMQMQALLGSPAKNNNLSGGSGLGAAGMGTGGSESPSYRSSKSFLNTPSSPSARHRLSKLNTSLSPALSRRGQSPAFSDILSASPATERRNPWRLSPSPPPRDKWSPSSPSQAWSPTRSSPTREVNNYLGRTASSAGNNTSSSSYRGLSPSIQREDRFSFSSTGSNGGRKEERGRSPSVRDDRFSFSSSGGGRESRFSSGSLNRFGSSGGGSAERPDRISTSSTLSSEREDLLSLSSSGLTAVERTLGNGASSEEYSTSTRKSFGGAKEGSSTLSSLKALRSSIMGDDSGKKTNKFSEQPKSARSSSGSSDTSLPPLSSPSLSPSYQSETLLSSSRKSSPFTRSNASNSDSLQNAISSLSSIGASDSDSAVAKFCFECGQKYPTNSAKFCCHCGARRPACEGN